MRLQMRCPEPSCSAMLKVPDSMLGKIAICPKCRRNIKIPNGTQAPDASSRPSASPRPGVEPQRASSKQPDDGEVHFNELPDVDMRLEVTKYFENCVENAARAGKHYWSSVKAAYQKSHPKAESSNATDEEVAIWACLNGHLNKSDESDGAAALRQVVGMAVASAMFGLAVVAVSAGVQWAFMSAVKAKMHVGTGTKGLKTSLMAALIIALTRLLSFPGYFLQSRIGIEGDMSLAVCNSLAYTLIGASLAGIACLLQCNRIAIPRLSLVRPDLATTELEQRIVRRRNELAGSMDASATTPDEPPADNIDGTLKYGERCPSCEQASFTIEWKGRCPYCGAKGTPLPQATRG